MLARFGVHAPLSPAGLTRGAILLRKTSKKHFSQRDGLRGKAGKWGCTSSRKGGGHARRSRPRALAAAGVEIDRAVRDREAEGRADGAFDQADLAAVGAHQLGHDGKPEPDAAGAGRALEGFEQMRARLLREPGAAVGDLDHHHRALAPAREADL